MKKQIIKDPKISLVLSKVESILTRFVYFLVPFITCLIYLLILKTNSLYPFGDKSIGWCDMNQKEPWMGSKALQGSSFSTVFTSLQSLYQVSKSHPHIPEWFYQK